MYNKKTWNKNKFERGLNVDIITKRIWDEARFERGIYVDIKINRHTKRDFPVFDFYDRNKSIVTSFKVMNFRKQIFQDTSFLKLKLDTYISVLDAFDWTTLSQGGVLKNSKINSRILDLIIPNVELTDKQVEILKEAINYTKSIGHNFTITVGVEK